MRHVQFAGQGGPRTASRGRAFTQLSIRQAPGQWWGSRNRATSIRSNRRSRLARSGREERNASAARAMRRLWRGVSAEAAAAISPRDLTSMTASTLPRRARISISPEGQRQPRATMRHPRSRKCQRQSRSAARPPRCARFRRSRAAERVWFTPSRPGDRALAGKDRRGAGRSQQQVLPRRRVHRAR